MIKGEIARRIVSALSSRAGESRIEEVRIGASYAAVRTAGQTGIAAVLRGETGAGCCAFRQAGSLAGRSGDDLLRLLISTGGLDKTVGLAAANSLLSRDYGGPEDDAISIMKLRPSDRVAMVGFFPPLIERITRTGAALDVLERHPRRGAITDPAAIDHALGGCTVAIITATTILNDTLEDILSKFDQPRHVALLGPSTPLIPEVFQDTKINHLGGAVVINDSRIMQIISEGGGTPAMRSCLKFVNLLI